MYEAFEILQPRYFREKDDIEIWGGKAKEWFVMEIAVFFFYGFTLIILLIKGKFVTIGIDSSY